MWCLARETAKGVYFGLVWVPLYRDIQAEIDRCGGLAEFRRTNGFVAPGDRLVVLRPDGSVKKVLD